MIGKAFGSGGAPARETVRVGRDPRQGPDASRLDMPHSSGMLLLDAAAAR